MIIQENRALADKNWFGTGGPARFYCEPSSDLEFQQAICFAAQHNLPVFVLGEGANILISDAGFSGLVIRPLMQDITEIAHLETATELYIQAGAGVSFEKLIEYCFSASALGLEEFSGIPGTVGGSVFINIHFFEFLLSRFLTSAVVIEKATGALSTVDNHWFEFGYNWSKLHKQDYYLVSAVFKLRKASTLDVAYARGRSDEIKRQRRHRYPVARTCGSFFRNFYEHEIDTQVTKITANKKIIHVGYYLDSLAIKGKLSYGGANVSSQHANMLVTGPQATTADVVQLARSMQKLLYEAYSLKAQPECRLIGFSEYPLIF